jgi:hypothetical protein
VDSHYLATGLHASRTYTEVRDELHAPKKVRYPLHLELGRRKSRSGRCEEVMKPLPVQGIKQSTRCTI